jgi:hypothetical protein
LLRGAEHELAKLGRQMAACAAGRRDGKAGSPAASDQEPDRDACDQDQAVPATEPKPVAQSVKPARPRRIEDYKSMSFQELTKDSDAEAWRSYHAWKRKLSA